MKKTNRILSVLLVFVMILGICPVFASNTVTINTAADLPATISEGQIYELSADIVLSSGQQISDIAGTLDGKGHTITLADKPLSASISGTVQNLGILTSATALTITEKQGSITNALSGTIQNCYSLASLAPSDLFDEIGGLVGSSNGGKIYNSYFGGQSNAFMFDAIAVYTSGGEIKNSIYSATSGIGMKDNQNTPTVENVEKVDDLSGITAVTKLNNSIVTTGYIWAQDTENKNGGFPYLVESTASGEVNKTALKNAIDKADLLNENDYISSGWSDLSTALTEAKSVYSSDETTQSDINTVLAKLESAINALEKKKPVAPVSQSDYTTVKHITSQSELEAIGAGTKDTYYILDNDITLDNWYFVFDSFNGVFDGNGHTITFTDGFNGLFKNVDKNGIVQNLHLSGSLSKSADCGAVAQEVSGAILNCYTDITGDENAAGFAKRLNGGIISNCYSVAKAKGGAIITQTKSLNNDTYTGTLRNVYWSNDLTQPVTLNELTLEETVKSLKPSVMKTLDFVGILNASKGTNGTQWGQGSNGYPYFGQNQTYTPNDEGITLSPNKTAIAFTSERTQTTEIIQNQDLKIDINIAVNGIAGLFSLPDYTLNDGESIEWSADNQSPADTAMVGSDEPYLRIAKEGTLTVKATLVKAGGVTEVLASTKVTVYTSNIDAIKLYIANFDDADGTEVKNGKATISGSEDMKILVKAMYSGEITYKTLSPSSFIFSLSDPSEAVTHIEGSNTFKFKKPGTAKMTVTYKNNASVKSEVELASDYVAVQNVKPSLSGIIELHGRNANSSGGEAFLPDYAGISVTPSNASYADSYTIDSSDSSIAEYVQSMVHGYVPRKAGNVTYTAKINDNGTEVSGTSSVTYVYKNPLKTVSVKSQNISMSVGDINPAGLSFQGTLNDGTEISESGMIWSFSQDGIVSVTRENGFWKRDTTDPDNGGYFLSSAYNLRALSEGTVTVTGTPIDTTGGAEPVSFTVTVSGNGSTPTDIFDTIGNGIGSAESYLKEQLNTLHNGDGVGYGYEWYIVSMLRAGKSIEQDIIDEYVTSATAEAKKWTSDVKPTDVERTALALKAAGKDVTNIDGINLISLICNSPKLNDGSNELAYALLTLKATGAKIPDTTDRTTDKIIAELLKFQATDGGFGLTDNASSSIDMTAICLQALAPYTDKTEVRTSVDKGLSYLKSKLADGFESLNSNSAAQVLLAAAELKIDITDSSNGFGNASYNIVSAIEGNKNPDGNGYMYEAKPNSMATVQVLQAYDAYRKAHKENLSYWDFGSIGKSYDDTSIDGSTPDDSTAKKAKVYVTIASDGHVVVGKNDEYVAYAPINVTDINKDGKLTVDEALYAAHEAYYDGGAAAGYGSYSTPFGKSLAKLWGKGTENTTAAAGYWLNNSSCISADDIVKDGDYIKAFNYCDATYYSDAFSYFDKAEVSAESGSSVTLTLKYINGYAPIISPCENAVVSFLGENNGIQETLTTDKNGQVTISFSNSAAEGSYYITATKDDNSIVPSVCKINLTDKESGSGNGSSSRNINVYIRVADPEGKTYLKKTAYTVSKGTSVYDLLKKTDLDVEITNSAYGVYVKSIEGLSEFDEGKGSGWMYRVNGDFMKFSSSLCTLSDGDYVEWIYTRDYGNDIGDSHYDDNTSGSSTSSKPNKNNTATSAPTTVGEKVYTDVDTAEWYADAVNYVTQNGLFGGVSDTEFAPNENMTRAMLVTVLYRLEKTSPVSKESKFSDVASGEWYTDAIIWASENKIVNGISDNEFAPDENVTREQTAAILYRYAKFKGYDTSSRADLSNFNDTDKISDYALDAIKWANAEKLINGTDTDTLSPDTFSTRAQVAAILMRFCQSLTE